MPEGANVEDKVEDALAKILDLSYLPEGASGLQGERETRSWAMEDELPGQIRDILKELVKEVKHAGT